LNDVQINNLKTVLKNYLDDKKIESAQTFYVLPSKTYFNMVYIYWRSEKVILGISNSFDNPKDLSTTEQVSRYDQDIKLDSSKKTLLTKLEVNP